ncbi:MAG: acyl-CoA dehydratase activase [Candidatus Thorarchaeota archaeon]
METQPRYGIGIDVGSTTTKAVLINSSGTVTARYLLATGPSAQNSVQRCFEALSALSKQDLTSVPVISTGYGRRQAIRASKSVTEITCHSIGIHSLNSKIQTLIDVGGQDSKVIRVGSDGRPTDFELNDKCSAGTGRFLEVMARVLDISIEELGTLSLKSDSPATISSTCTVFAESEVIGRISAGVNPADIAAGIHKSIAAKIAALSQRVGVQNPVAVTGGVALNPGFRFYLAQQLNTKLWIPKNPQYSGALGAAILAVKSVNE